MKREKERERKPQRVSRLVPMALVLAIFLHGAAGKDELSPASDEKKTATNVVATVTRSDNSENEKSPTTSTSTATPIHIVILFDVSSSHARDRLANAKTAVNSFLASLSGQVGDVVLIPFGDRARIAERSPLNDSKKVQAAIYALLANEDWTDHLGAFTLGESQVISRASQDGGRAIILMVTDREVSPPPHTFSPKTSFDELVVMAGLPDLKKTLRVQTWVLDFGGATQEVKAQIGATTIITTPGTHEEAIQLGRRLAAQSLELPPMITQPSQQDPTAMERAGQQGSPQWIQILAYFLSGCVSSIALYKGVKDFRTMRKERRAKSDTIDPHLIEEDKATPSRIYFLSSDEWRCRSRHIDVPSMNMPAQQAWISSASFIVPGVLGRVASLKVTSEGETFLRTTDAAESIRINGQALKRNATYELPVGACLSVGDFDFTVSDEKPVAVATSGRAARTGNDGAGRQALVQ